jgi:hypothetical protein
MGFDTPAPSMAMIHEKGRPTSMSQLPETVKPIRSRAMPAPSVARDTMV